MDYVNNIVNTIYRKGKKKKLIKPSIKINKNEIVVKPSKNKLKLKVMYDEGG